MPLSSPCLVFKFKRRGRILAPPLIKAINNTLQSNQGNMISMTCSCAVVIFDVIQGLQVNSVHEIDSMQLLSYVELMRTKQLFSDSKTSDKDQCVPSL